MASETPRGRMIRTTGRLLQHQGFHATGLKQILAESGAPRGSLYFYFPGGKEQLAVEAVREAGARTVKAVEALLSTHPDPRGAVQAFSRAAAEVLRQSDFKEGCPVATVTLEAADDSDAIRVACDSTYREWHRVIRDHLVGAELTLPRADALATLVLAAVEGGLILSRARRDIEPLQTVADELASLIQSLTDDADERSARRRRARRRR